VSLDSLRLLARVPTIGFSKANAHDGVWSDALTSMPTCSRTALCERSGVRLSEGQKGVEKMVGEVVGVRRPCGASSPHRDLKYLRIEVGPRPCVWTLNSGVDVRVSLRLSATMICRALIDCLGPSVCFIPMSVCVPVAPVRGKL